MCLPSRRGCPYPQCVSQGRSIITTTTRIPAYSTIITITRITAYLTSNYTVSVRRLGVQLDHLTIGRPSRKADNNVHFFRLGDAQVLGIEQFGVAHDRGSSHGLSRIIRLAYHEHESYVPLLKRAYTLWRELEKETGKVRLYPSSCMPSALSGHLAV
jgi:hypothetical protein